MLTGGCLCGAVRYETGAAPFHETVCHCTICRRASGAPMVAWFTVPLARFRFTQGAPAIYASSEKGRRAFCAACGTQLTFATDDSPGDIDVTTATLDDPGAVPPKDQTFVRSRIVWTKDAVDLPEFATSRSDA